MAGLAGVIGGIIALGGAEGDMLLLLPVFIAVFLITGAGNAVNDYFDASIDAVNRPERPIPSGRIERRSVLTAATLLFAAGAVISFFIGLIPFIIAAYNSLLLFFYAFSLKRKVFVGNLSVSYLTGSTFLFGGSAFGQEGIRLTLVLFLLSMLATLAREIVKAIEDMKGDMKEGAATLPIRIGERPSAYLASAFGILGIMLSPVPFVMGMFNEYYLMVVGAADIVFIYAVLLALEKQPAKSSKYFKVAMFVALVAFVAGRLLR
jgi:geranylgeranylglycerol-phosphate geranylgeranyltransferase